MKHVRNILIRRVERTKKKLEELTARDTISLQKRRLKDYNKALCSLGRFEKKHIS